MGWRRKEWILGVVPAVAGALGLTEAARAEKAEWVSGDFSQKLPPGMQQAMAWPQPRPAPTVPVGNIPAGEIILIQSGAGIRP